LLAECNYGGRITDNCDRRLIKVYASEIFNDDLVSIERWRPPLTEELNYQYAFDESNLKGDQAAFIQPEVFRQEILTQMQEGNDPAIAFGQHPNAEIAAQIAETNELLENIVNLQPLVITGSGQS